MGRLAAATDAASDAALARMLGLSTGDFAQRKARGRIPWDRVIPLAGSRNVSVDWLVSGEGDRAPAGSQAEDEGEYLPLEAQSGPSPGISDGPSDQLLRYRLDALAGLLVQLDPGHSEAILSAAFARATDAQRLAELEQAVASLPKPRHKKRAKAP